MSYIPRTDQLRIFMVAAECKDFSEAARVLGKMPSFISRSIAQLEAELGFSLFVRSTRQVALTDAGIRYYGVCRTLLTTLDETGRQLRGEQGFRRLHLHMAASLQDFFMPALSEFCREFPECRFVIGASEQDADLLLLDRVPDSAWPVLPLGDMEWLYVAAPSYLQRSGRLVGFSDLSRQCMVLTSAQVQHGISMRQADAFILWHPQNIHVCDNVHGVLSAVRQGLGVGFLPRYMLWQDVLCGALLRVLDPLLLPGSGVFCVFNPTLEQTDIMLPLLREKLAAYYRVKQKSAVTVAGQDFL